MVRLTGGGGGGVPVCVAVPAFWDKTAIIRVSLGDPPLTKEPDDSGHKIELIKTTTFAKLVDLLLYFISCQCRLSSGEITVDRDIRLDLGAFLSVNEKDVRSRCFIEVYVYR